jgi:hypothetical protein
MQSTQTDLPHLLHRSPVSLSGCQWHIAVAIDPSRRPQSVTAAAEMPAR